MRFVMMAVVLGVAGYFAWQQTRTKPAPPPPPPPAILVEPAPLINEDEQTKIIKSANDQDAMVRWESIVFLDKMKVPAAFDVMFEKMAKDPDIDLRIKVIKLLGERGAQKVTLQTDTKNPFSVDPVVLADTTVREKRTTEIAEHLVLATKDSQPEIRLAALQALDALSDYSVASAVTDSLKDADERVRLQALKTLNSLQDKKAALIEAEKRRQEELRRQAEKAAKGH